MAAPTKTVRQAPVGARLTDGHPTTVAFAARPAVSFWETKVKPPGFKGGDPNNITTMLNTKWLTFMPKKLITLSPMTMMAAYDSRILTDIQNLINVNTSVTVWMSDGDCWVFWGVLNDFEPQEAVEGEMPIANVTVTPTN